MPMTSHEVAAAFDKFMREDVRPLIEREVERAVQQIPYLVKKEIMVAMQASLSQEICEKVQKHVRVTVAVSQP